MHDAVLREFPTHDLLIMAAAVADYRPIVRSADKLPRQGKLTIECEATEDIIAAAGKIKRADQRTVGFSLELRGNVDRAREKLLRKNLDLIVYNPTETMDSTAIEATLIWADGRSETPCRGGEGGICRKPDWQNDAVIWRGRDQCKHTLVRGCRSFLRRGLLFSPNLNRRLLPPFFLPRCR